MYVILLRFTGDRGRAPQFMDGHQEWIRRGFDDGVFLVVGSLQTGAGGGILAHNASPAEIAARVAADPFVAQELVTPEIIEIDPSRTDARLNFLLG